MIHPQKKFVKQHLIHNMIQYSLTEKRVLMSNASTFAVMNLKGKMLTTQNFDLPIESVLPMGTRGRYIMVNSKYIQDIRLQ